MKKLLALLSVVIFTNQANAEENDKWWEDSNELRYGDTISVGFQSYGSRSYLNLSYLLYGSQMERKRRRKEAYDVNYSCTEEKDFVRPTMIEIELDVLTKCLRHDLAGLPRHATTHQLRLMS